MSKNRLMDLSMKDIDLLSKIPAITSIRVLAASMNVEPSSISRSIQQLEDILEVKLLVRSKRGVTPTADAKVISKKAQDICETMQNLVTARKGQSQAFQRFLNIGSRGFINTFIAPKICNSFEKILDDRIGFRFLDLSPTETIAASKQGCVDVLLTFDEARLGTSWKTSKVGHIEWALYARYGHPISESSSLSLLGQQRVGHHCAFDGNSILTSDGMLFESLGIRQFGHGAQSAYTALAIASQTDHLACVPTIVAESIYPLGKVRRLNWKELDLSSPIYMSIHLDRVNQLESKNLHKIMRDLFSSQISP